MLFIDHSLDENEPEGDREAVGRGKDMVVKSFENECIRLLAESL